MTVVIVVMAVALMAVFWIGWYRVFRRDWLPQLRADWRPSWRRQAVGWAGLVLAISLAVILIDSVDLDGVAKLVVWVVFVSIPASAAWFRSRRDRRKGITRDPPFMQNGPAGWEWDPDAATWRKPRSPI